MKNPPILIVSVLVLLTIFLSVNLPRSEEIAIILLVALLSKPKMLPQNNYAKY